jgi:replication-associated recombination protein RarA
LAAEASLNQTDDDYVILLKDGTPFAECLSGLQKAIRRGWEREALIFALGLYDSGFGAALARRVGVIAAEDVGLADPVVAAQACVFSSTWLAIRKDQKHQPDVLLLALGVLLLCKANKSREVDSACVVVREEQKRMIGERPKDVIARNYELIVDSHTSRGKSRLRKMADNLGVHPDVLYWQDFLTNGAVISPHFPVDGDKWTKRVYELFGLDRHNPKTTEHT